MPRPKQRRWVSGPPLMQGFKPFGIPRGRLGSVILLMDEYESVRLLDYEGLSQEQAAERMRVSRPTLTRIYEQARKTIAEALVEGKMIRIEGGDVLFDCEWFRCRRCHRLVNGKENHARCKGCAMYGDDELIPLSGIDEEDGMPVSGQTPGFADEPDASADVEKNGNNYQQNNNQTV